MESTEGAVLDAINSQTSFPWETDEVTATTSEHLNVGANAHSGSIVDSGELPDAQLKGHQGIPTKPSTAAKVRLIYGAELNVHPGFANAIDGKKLDNSAMYFQVSPYAFARRSMMRTATVRTLLLERKLPRLVDANDQLMVIVSMDWVTGRTNPQSLSDLGFNPEDYFDAE